MWLIHLQSSRIILTSRANIVIIHCDKVVQIWKANFEAIFDWKLLKGKSLNLLNWSWNGSENFFEQPADNYLVSQFAKTKLSGWQSDKKASFRRGDKRRNIVEACGRNLSKPWKLKMDSHWNWKWFLFGRFWWTRWLRWWKWNSWNCLWKRRCVWQRRTI